MTVSTLILTLNEEANIAACLDSLAWCDDVVVLDSGSTDRTVEIATARGARVLHRPFDDYARQRNFGLRDIPYRHPWLLMLDADERVPPDLAAEVVSATRAAADEVCLFRMRRKDYLFGRWIRGSGGYPTWFGRLARLGRVWVERPINEQYCTDGQTLALQGHLHHQPFQNGFSPWIARHDRYSTMEASVLAEELRADAGTASLFSRDPVERRKAQKRLLYRLPGRPLLVFLALYLARGGLFEGRAGLTYAALRAWYELLIDLKVRERQRRQRGLPV